MKKTTKMPAKAISQHKGMAMGKKMSAAAKAPVMMKKGGKVKAMGKCK